MKNKPYKLGQKSADIKRRNILEGIVPSEFKYRETLEQYCARKGIRQQH